MLVHQPSKQQKAIYRRIVETRLTAKLDLVLIGQLVKIRIVFKCTLFDKIERSTEISHKIRVTKSEKIVIKLLF